jgi:hypothetical protein
MKRVLNNEVLEWNAISGLSIEELDEIKYTLTASLKNVVNRTFFLSSRYSKIKTVNDLKEYLLEPNELNTVSSKLANVIVEVAGLEEVTTIEQFLKRFLKYPKVGMVTKTELTELLSHLKKINRYDDVAE